MRFAFALLALVFCEVAAAQEKPSLRKLNSFPKDYVGQTFTYVCYLAHPPYMKNEMESMQGWTINLLTRHQETLTDGGLDPLGREKLCVVVDEEMAKNLMDAIPAGRLRKFAVTFTVHQEESRDKYQWKFFAGRVTKLENLGEKGPPAEQ